jgi:hypothetical protein
MADIHDPDPKRSIPYRPPKPKRPRPHALVIVAAFVACITGFYVITSGSIFYSVGTGVYWSVAGPRMVGQAYAFYILGAIIGMSGVGIYKETEYAAGISAFASIITILVYFLPVLSFLLQYMLTGVGLCIFNIITLIAVTMSEPDQDFVNAVYGPNK